MPYVPPTDELARNKKRYYREKRPDLDPQSTVSKIMEFFGADEPYREDAGSYDYRQKKWDRSVKGGNPDVSWMLPALSDSAAETITSTPKRIAEDVAGIGGGAEHAKRDDPGFATAILREQLGREPSEDEVAGALEAIQNDTVARENMTGSLGRAPTKQEWAQWKQLTTDPRDTSERNAGAVLNLLDLPLLGAADETVAGAMSLTGRGSYEDELAKARKIKRRYQENEPGLSARNIASTAGGVGSLFLGPAAASYHAADALWRGGRGAMGLAPEATSLLGKAAAQVIPGGAAGAADFAGLGFNEGEGGLDKRLENVSADDVKSGAIGGGILFPLFGAAGSGMARAGRAAGSQAKRIGQSVAKRFGRGSSQEARAGVPPGPKPTEPRKPNIKPIPKEPGDDSIRDALDAAFKKQAKKVRRN